MSPSKTFLDLPDDVLYLIMRQFDSFPSLHAFLLVSKVHTQVFEFNKGTIASAIAANQFDREAFEVLNLSRPCSLAKPARKMYLKDLGPVVGKECVEIAQDKNAFGLAEAKRMTELDWEIREVVSQYEARRGKELSKEQRKDVHAAVCNMWILTSCFKWERDGSRINGLYDYNRAVRMKPRAIAEVLDVLDNLENAPPISHSLTALLGDFKKFMSDIPGPTQPLSDVDLSILALHTITEDKTNKILLMEDNTDDDDSKMPILHHICKTQYVDRDVCEKFSDGSRRTITILVRTPLRVRKYPPVKQIRRADYVKRKYRTTLAVEGSGPPTSSAPGTPSSTTCSTPVDSTFTTPAHTPRPTSGPQTPMTYEDDDELTAEPEPEAEFESQIQPIITVTSTTPNLDSLHHIHTYFS